MDFQKPQHYDKRLYKMTDYEHLAQSKFFRHANDYFNSGANDEVTLNGTFDAYREIKLKQATFVDDSKWKGTETEILGKKIESPICMTSTAFQRMATPQGEVLTAKACQSTNTPMVLSSWATTTNEVIGATAPDCVKVYQVYPSKSHAVNADIWARVKNSGFSALALTTDTQLLGKRLNDTRNRFELPHPFKMENFVKYMNKGENANIKSSGGSGLAEYVKKEKNNEISWDVIPYMQKVSGLPVFAKGVMCADDARIAVENGVDGIYVSNHGARQLDTTPATIEVLKEIADEVERVCKQRGIKKVPVWFDGGVRSGSDVLKALALGADIVWIGRGVLWALACEGQTGVENIIRILNEELKEAMLRCGCYSLEDIKKKKIFYDKDELMFAKL